jgi:hypothetical protein
MNFRERVDILRASLHRAVRVRSRSVAKLKVFRTSTGFHDAYVAAPSQKAALAAWGVKDNLFAQRLAEQVTDEAVMAEALASPGVVIKKLRGSEAEHFAALGPMPERQRAKPAATEADRPPKAEKQRAPRPSREALDSAEAALQAAQDSNRSELAVLEKQISELRQRQQRLLANGERELARLQSRVEREQQRYKAALERWRR